MFYWNLTFDQAAIGLCWYHKTNCVASFHVHSFTNCVLCFVNVLLLTLSCFAPASAAVPTLWFILLTRVCFCYENRQTWTRFQYNFFFNLWFFDLDVCSTIYLFFKGKLHMSKCSSSFEECIKTKLRRACDARNSYVTNLRKY